MLDSVRPAPELGGARPFVSRLSPPVTSLSALARSKHPVAAVSSAPPSKSRPPKGPRGLGRYVALGVGLSVCWVAGLSQTPETQPSAEESVLHGAPGVKHTSKGNEVRWRKRQTKVYIDSSVDRLGPQARDAIRGAFGTWLETNARLPGVAFDSISGVTVDPKPDGKNTVTFAPITVKGHERDLAITLTYSDEATGDIIESDIVINANYPFELIEQNGSQSKEPSVVEPDGQDPDEPGTVQAAFSAQANGTDNLRVNSTVRSEQRSSCVAQQVEPACGRDVYDVQNVLTHEVGHFFGLGEDAENTASTMYVCTNRCETHKRMLTNADTTTLTSLYQGEFTDSEDSAAEAVGCQGARLAPTGSPVTGALFAAAAALVLAARRRR